MIGSCRVVLLDLIPERSGKGMSGTLGEVTGVLQFGVT